MLTQPRKLELGDWNPMMVHTARLIFSGHGLLMLAVTVIVGGGGIWLLMGKLTMQGLGYFIVQPSILSLYLICCLARYRSGNPRLPAKREARNIVISVMMGALATAALLSVLFALRVYTPAANAAELHAVPVGSSSVLSPSSYQPLAVSFISVFPVMFNIFSIASFTILGCLPFLAVLVGAIVNCDAPLHRNVTLMLRGLLKNIGTMVLLSLFSFCLMGGWSYLALRHEALIFTSVVPLVFLFVLSYVMAEQIYLPEKSLTNKAGYTPRHKVV